MIIFMDYMLTTPQMSKRMGFSVVGLPHYTIWHLYEPSVDDIRHMEVRIAMPVYCIWSNMLQRKWNKSVQLVRLRRRRRQLVKRSLKSNLMTQTASGRRTRLIFRTWQRLSRRLD